MSMYCNNTYLFIVRFNSDSEMLEPDWKWKSSRDPDGGRPQVPRARQYYTMRAQLKRALQALWCPLSPLSDDFHFLALYRLYTTGVFHARDYFGTNICSC